MESEQIDQQPDQADGRSAQQRRPQHRCAEAPRRDGAAVGADIIPGNADCLIYQLLGCDTAACGRVVADDEDRLLKNMRVGGIHHDDPSGNTFYQELCPPLAG